MFGLGTQELLIILIIAFFVFGGKRLPEIGAGLGKGLRAFKDSLRDLDKDVDPKQSLATDHVSGTSSDIGDKKAQ